MAKWNLDPTHSSAEFSARHMMVTTVRGSIKNATGWIEFDQANPAGGAVEVNLPAAEIFSGLADRDNHLKSPDFLDVANYPHITFKSTQVEVTGENEGKITGHLTIRDVTKPVTLDVEFLGQEKDPWSGGARIGFTGSTKINREDFGLTWNVALESGGFLVGKEIKITVDAEAIAAQ
jgi:polyisoprenoid-binding protein YceI